MRNLNGLVCICTPKMMSCLTKWNLGLLLQLGTSVFFVYVMNLLHTCLLFVLSYLQAYFLALGNFMFAAASMQMQFPRYAPPDPTRTLLDLICIVLNGSYGIEWSVLLIFMPKIFHTFYCYLICPHLSLT